MAKKINPPIKGDMFTVECKNSYCEIKPTIRGPYTSIYLVRHCHPNYELQEKLGDKNMPLSEIGLKQREYLTEKLLSVEPNKIYSSEIKRAIESVEPVAKCLKKRIIRDKRLNEIDWKYWYRVRYFNMSEKRREKDLAGYKQMDEQLDKFQAKARRIVADLWKKNIGKKIIVSCHGNLIKAIVTGIINSDVIGFLSFEIYQSSVTKLVIDRDGYIKINYINNFAHLPKNPGEDLFQCLISQ